MGLQCSFQGRLSYTGHYLRKILTVEEFIHKRGRIQSIGATCAKRNYHAITSPFVEWSSFLNLFPKLKSFKSAA